MSDSLLRLIPLEPQFEPSSDAAEEAALALKALIPAGGAVNTRRFSEIRFVDQGSNFESVICPHCLRDITNHWSDWMDECSKSQFTQRKVAMPCCQQQSDLNDLVYEWPAGFARFVLEVENPDPAEWLSDSAQKSLENILGCGVRQILAHY